MPNEFIDFKTIKQRVSMSMVLAHYGINLHYSNKTELRGKCPLPTHTSKTASESFGVQTEKQIWACQSQSCAAARDGKRGGNILDFVAVMDGCSIRDAAVRLNNWFPETPVAATALPPVPASSTGSTDKLVAEKKTDTPVGESNRPLTFALKDVDPKHPYVESRGITEKTAREFGLGFFSGRGSMHGRVVIPIHNERGELVAYAGRAIDQSEPKYKLPSGFHKSVELFNLHRAATSGEKTVVIVEGYFGCMHVHQAGFPCVALMGSSFSAEQLSLLSKYFSGALLMLDGDEAGRECTKKLLVELGSRMWVKAAWLSDTVQPDQLEADQIQALIS